MKKSLFSLSLILLTITVLAACASTDVLTPTPQATLEPLPTIDLANQAPLEEDFPGEFSDCVLPIETDKSPFPVAPVSAQDRWQGAANPALTITVYLDPQCPYCAALHPVLEILLREYPDQLKVVYRQMPLIMLHQNALKASQALEAAAQQEISAYFSLQNTLYVQQSQWESLPEEEFNLYLIEKAQELNLDITLFEKALNDETIQTQLLTDLDTALQAGITYSPFILINDQSYGNLSMDLNTLRTVVELTLLEEKQFGECPPKVIEDDQNYTATLVTDKGDVIIELFPELAPLAVNNFIFLAEQGWYDQVPFYRVLPDAFALTGDPTGSSMGGPGYTFRSETDPALDFSLPGMVAMNNAGAPNTNGSQFFITYQAMPELNGKFSIFGQVIAGFDILQQLTPRDPMVDTENIQPDLLLSVTINSK